MSSLSERLAKTRQAQVAAQYQAGTRALDEAAKKDAGAPQESFETVLADFKELFPSLTKFWGYSREEQENLVREGSKPENLVPLVKEWMTNAIMFDIPTSGPLRVKCHKAFAVAVREMRAEEQAKLVVRPGAPVVETSSTAELTSVGGTTVAEPSDPARVVPGDKPGLAARLRAMKNRG